MKKIFFLAIIISFFLISQAQVSKTVNITTAGSLSSVLTTEEKNTITNLTLTGNIDARDFKTMRDLMPLLTEVDLVGITIATYTGTEGTYGTTNYLYNSQEVPFKAFANKTVLKNILLSPMTTAIGSSAFYGCTGLSQIIIPNSITFIGNYSFYGCIKLSSLTIPYSVSDIKTGAFRGCIGLTSVNILATISSIENYLFCDCNGLTSITIPSSITSIGAYAFKGCNRLSSITIPSLVTSIGSNSFSFCSGLTSVTFQNLSSVTSIGEYAFYQCYNLNNINIPNSVNLIGSWAFGSCVALNSITIPRSLTTIGESVFDSSGLKTITIPNSVTSIGSGAFAGCDSLSSVSFESPSSLTSIGEYAFEYCTGLASIQLPSSLTSIGYYSFGNCYELTTINIPSFVSSIGQSVFNYCDKLVTLVVDEDNPYYSFADGVLFNKKKTDLILCLNSKTGSYSIPSTVSSITTEAFCYCSKLTSLTIPSSINSIGSSAFHDCSGLTSIYINHNSPINLSTSINVFFKIDKDKCILYVPFGSKTAYQTANQWQDFTNIVEMPGFKLSAATATITAGENSSASIDVTSNTTWSTSSDQTWLTVNLSTNTGNGTLTLTATANPNEATRTATITVSATGVDPQTITVTQAAKQQDTKTVNIEAGGLAAALSSEEKNTITKLTLTGTIDARDFKTMRDDMPLLAEVDLGGTTIVAYTGTEGTGGWSLSYIYPNDEIPRNAFFSYETYSAKPLNTIILPQATKSIGILAFFRCNFNEVVIPSVVEAIDANAFTQFSGSIVVDLNNLNYSSLDGVLFNKKQTTLLKCPISKSGVYSIPSSVIKVDNYAFNYCYNLTNVILPSSLIVIGEWSFYKCIKLTEVKIPVSVTTIGSCAFYFGGTSFSVDQNNPNFSDIDGVLFDKNKTKLIQCPFTRTGVCEIPPSVKTIGNYAFGGCENLTEVIIPLSVTSIEESAFYNCSGLTSIYAGSFNPVPLYNINGDGVPWYVFYGVNKTTCKLYVPYGSSGLYKVAPEWGDFANIIEMHGFKLSKTQVIIGSNEGSTVQTDISSDVTWNVTPDQEWLAVSPTSGTGNGVLTFTATANPANTTRTATITISATGVEPQTITVIQPYMLQCNITKLYDFSGTAASGKLPVCSLVESGNYLYGTTSSGGDLDFGTIFKINKDGSGYTKLFDFKDSETGIHPVGQLTLIENTLYGTTVGNDYFEPVNGITDHGCIFKINTDGSGFVKLHQFDETNGKEPNGSMVLYNGSLYGITNRGGVENHGVIFKINPDGSGFSKISDNTDTGTGENPYNGIIISNDVIYGVSTVDYGGVFKVNIDGTGLTKIFEMDSESGDFSYCKPLLIGNELYVTTSEGGTHGVGAIFKIKTDGIGFTVLYNFEGMDDDPESSGFRNNSLVYHDGMLFGTATDGINSHGYLYKIGTDGTGFVKLSDFDGEHGSTPYMCDLVIDNYKNIYGMTSMGGINDGGVVYKYSMNKIPVANAGTDQTVNEGSLVTLDGSGSSDSDGNAITYVWAAPNGITLSAANVAKPTFTAPDVAQNTSYTFSLVVNDGTVDSPADQVVITVKPVIDYYPPTIMSFMPMNMSINVPRDLGQLVITFDENIKAGVGSVKLYNNANVLIETISKENWNISSNTLTIPINSLAYNTTYYVLIDQGAIQDFAGNIFSGISNKSQFSFKTETEPHFTPVWTGNGQDQMSFNVVLAKLDGTDLQASDEIAVFDGTKCVGVGKLNSVVSSQNALTFVASKDDGSGNGYTAGNPITFKIWDLSQQKEYTVSAAYLNEQPTWSTSGKYEANATCFVEINAVNQSTQTVSLSNGWNVISANVLPENKDLMHNMQTLVDAGKLVKVQDERGKTVENWGIFGGWKNLVGDMTASEGYKVKVNADCLLELTGVPTQLPYDIDLSNGWNIISFPHTAEVNGSDVVQALVTAGTLVKVQDEKGQTIENWGIFGGWKNLIGNFKPGEGYKVKVNQDTKLTINSSYTKSTAVPVLIARTEHFVPVFKGNGTDHTDINLVDLPENILEPGDEIAAFDQGICVGSVKITERNLKSEAAQLIASANDQNGSPGFTEGNKIELKLWKQSTDNEYNLPFEFLIGSASFEKNESSFVSLKNSATGLTSLVSENGFSFICYPNPTNGELFIKSSFLSSNGSILQVFTLTGKKISEKQIENLIERIDLSNLTKGCYFIKVIVDGQLFVHKVILK